MQQDGQSSGPPPPYPDPPESTPANLPKLEELEIKELLVDNDLKACTHWHTVLVSMVAPGGGSDEAGVDSKKPGDWKMAARNPEDTQERFVLHFWSPAGAVEKSSQFIPTHLSEEKLQYIQGYQDLGSFVFPLEENAGPAEIHEYLTSLSAGPSIPDGTEDESAEAEEQEPEDAVEVIGAQLATMPSSGEGLHLRMFTISVISDSPDALFNAGDAPAWKWAKPSNIYGPKTGNWAIEPSAAVEQAEWLAGRDIMLLVRGFYEEHRVWLATNPASRLPRKGENPAEGPGVAQHVVAGVFMEP